MDIGVGETGYEVERDGVVLGSVGADATSFTDPDLAISTEPLSYRVRTTGSSGKSDWSESVSVTVDFPSLVNTAIVTDNSDGFGRLNDPNGVSTVRIGQSTYALVGSQLDNGVQIMDITNPAVPTPTANLSDGVDGYERLDNANSVATVTIDSSVYALVSAGGDGVQIIDISDPSDPSPTASVPGVLISPIDVETINIGSSVYALVAAFAGDGLQIVDITNPASPSQTAVPRDGTVFTALDAATDVETVAIGDATYALVTAASDDGVQIIDITDPSNPTATAAVTDGNDGFDMLDEARDLSIETIGSSTYAFVAASLDDGVQIIDISNPVNPTAVASVTDEQGGYDELDGAWGITTVSIGASWFAFVPGAYDKGLQVIDISDPDNPLPVTSIAEGQGGFNTFSGAKKVTSVTIDSSLYVLVTLGNDDSVQIIGFDW